MHGIVVFELITLINSKRTIALDENILLLLLQLSFQGWEYESDLQSTET